MVLCRPDHLSCFLLHDQDPAVKHRFLGAEMLFHAAIQAAHFPEDVQQATMQAMVLDRLNILNGSCKRVLVCGPGSEIAGLDIRLKVRTSGL